MIDRKAQNDLFAGAFARLVSIAVRWTHNGADAEDLAQQALADAFAASSEVPRDLRELVRRAGSIMKGHFLNRRRAEKRRQEPRWLAVAARLSRGLQRTPEDVKATREQGGRMLDRLLEALKGDTLACGIVRATVDGFDTPAEQAECLAVDITEIRKARRRLERAVEAVRAREGRVHVGHDGDADEGASVAEDEREDALESGEAIEE